MCGSILYYVCKMETRETILYLPLMYNVHTGARSYNVNIYAQMCVREYIYIHICMNINKHTYTYIYVRNTEDDILTHIQTSFRWSCEQGAWVRCLEIPTHIHRIYVHMYVFVCIQYM